MVLTAEAAVLAQLDKERQEKLELIARLDKQILEGYTKVTTTSDVRHKAWAKVEKSIPKQHNGKLDYADPKLVEKAEEAERLFHRADHDVNALIAAKERHKRDLKKLDDPTEIERRTTNKERLGMLREQKKQDRAEQRDQLQTAKAARVKVVKVTAKEQGFPEIYLGPTGNFNPGADATAKHDLVCSILRIKEPVKHKFDPRVAKRLVAARGWEPFVEKRRQTVEAEAKRAQRAKTSK